MRLLPSIHARLAPKYGYRGSVLDADKESVLLEDIHVYPPCFFDSPKFNDINKAYCVHYQMGAWHPGRDGHEIHPQGSVRRKRDLFFFLFTWINKLLAKKRLQIRVMSV